MPRPINQAGLDLVKHFEGLSLEAYRCPAGVLTIGYGHTQGVRDGERITEAEADELLARDLEYVGEHVERLMRVHLGDNQYAALCSWAFNVGIGAVIDSTLRELLNAGDYDAVPAQLIRWTKATVGGRKVELPGLVRRRAAEVALWLQDAKPLPGQSMPRTVEI